MEWIKIIVPSVIPLIGVLIGIAALWWKITTSVATRAEMNRADDKLQEQINLVTVSIQAMMKELREDMRQLRSDILKLDEKMDTGFTRLDEKIDANSQGHHREINKLNEKMDAGFTRLDKKIDANSQAQHREINKLNEKMDAGFTRLDEKIDANSRAHHRDIMQVIDKIDGVANDLRAEIRERTSGKTDDVDS